MSYLKIYNNANIKNFILIKEFNAIKKNLQEINVYFERWETKKILPNNHKQEEIIKLYESEINSLKHTYNFTTVDVISVNQDTPNINEIRNKFLHEHTHSEDEVRFFIYGQGLFYIHHNNRVYGILCKKNDLIHIPAGTKHWFDMGNKPDLKSIRFFSNNEGWVAKFTGNDIAKDFPLLENK